MKRFLLNAIVLSGMFIAQATLAADVVVKILNHEPTTREEKEYLLNTAKKFESANPNVKVQFTFMDDTSFKAKLPTLLQSRERPDAFFTWSGGVFHEQAETGMLRDITKEVSDEAKARYSKIGLEGMSYKGKLYGIPVYAANILIWYNGDLLKKGGIDPSGIKTWDDFLAACTKLKSQGITPIVIGGKDKWPLAFFYGPLAMRIAGTDGIAAANEGRNGGFTGPDFLRVAQEYKRLIDIQPFQPGFMDTGFHKSVGLFGDGKGAFLPINVYVIEMNAKNSTSGKGIGESLNFIPYPMVANGKGDPKDTFGGVNGFLLTKDAKPEAIRFLEYLTNVENQRESARLGLWIPTTKGTAAELKDPRVQQAARLLEESPHHQLYLDQALGAIVGSAVNDAAAELATGDITPKQAVEKIEEARKIR